MFCVAFGWLSCLGFFFSETVFLCCYELRGLILFQKDVVFHADSKAVDGKLLDTEFCDFFWVGGVHCFIIVLSSFLATSDVDV